MVRFEHNPTVDDRLLNELFAASWPGHIERSFQPVLKLSLGYIGAFAEGRLIGFVNVAWDGGEHAFILDTTVHPEFQRQGVGTQLVREAAEMARRAGVTWLHVDCEPSLKSFYQKACGFVPTAAGLMKLN